MQSPYHIVTALLESCSFGSWVTAYDTIIKSNPKTTDVGHAKQPNLKPFEAFTPPFAPSWSTAVLNEGRQMVLLHYGLQGMMGYACDVILVKRLEMLFLLRLATLVSQFLFFYEMFDLKITMKNNPILLYC